MPPATRARARAHAVDRAVASSAVASSGRASRAAAEPTADVQPPADRVFVLASWDPTKPGSGAWLQAWRAHSPMHVARHALNALLNGESPLVFESHDVDALVASCHGAVAAQPQLSDAVVDDHAARLLLLLHPRDETATGGSEGVMFSLVRIEDLTVLSSEPATAS